MSEENEKKEEFTASHFTGQVIDLYNQIAGNSDKYCRERGISPKPPKPSMPEGLEGFLEYDDYGSPIMPDLTKLPSENLGQLLVYYNRWAEYLHGIETDLATRKDDIKKSLAGIEAVIREDLRGKGTKTSEMKDKMMLYADADGNLIWVMLDSRLQEMTSRYKKVEMAYKNSRSAINIVSREITRVEADTKIAQRERNTGRSNFNNANNEIINPKKSRSKPKEDYSNFGNTWRR